MKLSFNLHPAFLIFPLLALAVAACQFNGLPGFGDAKNASGSVLIQDDFTNPASGWDRMKSAEGIMDYDAGSYRMLVNALQVDFWATPHKDYSDVRMEVDAGKLGGPDENRIGLICRYWGDQYYFFMISSDGYYGLGIFTHGQAALLGQSVMTASQYIKTGTAINHLRADCQGSQLSFYVNGFPLAQLQDPTLKHGDIGLLAGTFSQPGVDIVFDNFIATTP